MIKSQQVESKPAVCWSKEPQIPSLRVELSGDILFVFPYIHFEFAKMESHKEQNILLLSFSSHEIRITGRNLKELGIAVQRLSVEWVRETPPRYAALAKQESAFIEKIEVEAREDSPPIP